MYFCFGDAPDNVLGAKFGGVFQARCFQQVLKGVQRVLVVVEYPFAFQGNVQFVAPAWVLGGYPAGAASGMAVKGLDASEGKHITASSVAPVCAESQRTGDVKGRGD